MAGAGAAGFGFGRKGTRIVNTGTPPMPKPPKPPKPTKQGGRRGK